MKKISIPALVVLLLTGCIKTDLPPTPTGGNSTLVGTWRLYETGASPGDPSYIITPVPANPAQTLTFTGAGTSQRQGDRLTGFYASPYYRVDSTKSGLRLRFLTSRTDTTGFSVGLSFSGKTMKLSPPCIEGCHLGFERIQ